MERFFKDCKTAEDGKKLYRKLAIKFHPDNNSGSDEMMKILNSQFKEFWDRFKDIHKTESGETYTSKKTTTETAEDFIEIISALAKFDSIEIEICGSWLWLSGKTFPFKDELKSLGCRWSASKKKWYWTKDEFYKTRHTLTEEQRRAKYGSEMVDTTPYRRVKLETCN